MNIFEISGVNNDGLMISEMVEKETLKEAIEYGSEWAKQQIVMLQSVKMAYLDTH